MPHTIETMHRKRQSEEELDSHFCSNGQGAECSCHAGRAQIPAKEWRCQVRGAEDVEGRCEDDGCDSIGRREEVIDIQPVDSQMGRDWPVQALFGKELLRLERLLCLLGIRASCEASRGCDGLNRSIRWSAESQECSCAEHWTRAAGRFDSRRNQISGTHHFELAVVLCDIFSIITKQADQNGRMIWDHIPIGPQRGRGPFVRCSSAVRPRSQGRWPEGSQNQPLQSLDVVPFSLL